MLLYVKQISTRTNCVTHGTVLRILSIICMGKESEKKKILHMYNGITLLYT